MFEKLTGLKYLYFSSHQLLSRRFGDPHGRPGELLDVSGRLIDNSESWHLCECVTTEQISLQSGSLPPSILHLKGMIIQAQNSFTIIHSWHQHHKWGICYDQIQIGLCQVIVKSLWQKLETIYMKFFLINVVPFLFAKDGFRA